MANQNITAAKYNFLQGRIQNILGVGSGTSGYNQSVQSYSVNVSGDITATHLNNLHVDMTKARAHQTGVQPTEISQVIKDLNVVTDDNDSFFVSDQGTQSSDPDGDTKKIQAFEDLMTLIEQDKFVIDSTQAGFSSAGVNSSRTQIWGGTALPQIIVHEFTVKFGNENQRRAFFNSGGEIRLEASVIHNLSPGDNNYAKTNDWSNMLSAMKTIKFNYNSTDSFELGSSDGNASQPTNNGTGSAIGNYQLTGNYQTVYTKTGSGLYEDNEYVVKAKENNSREISFRIEFIDDANGAGSADEAVQGSTASQVSVFRAEGIYVEVPYPAFQNLNTLDQATVSIPDSSNITCISVIDECSRSESEVRTDWLNFRNGYPNRPFYALQPGGSSRGSLKEPAEYQNDSNAFGPVQVNRDNNNSADASNWFNICNLGSLPTGSSIALSIDNSGSMTDSTVQASIDLLYSDCASANININRLSMSAERWILPFDRDL
jgi:hypothetical protein